ncbi:hypothetical protein F5Y12DRAFT_799206 [Xylaria sp. FL1777]|nr:hypothetical protein F5Y12DRAFT_799206 [Xylaria sp. FL1777]
MLSRSLRSVTARAPSLATNPIRSRAILGPFSIRTIASTETATFPPPSTAEASRRLPYFVGRNNLHNLSVYLKKKRGGNHKITTLKNCEGDLAALKLDLKTALQLHDNEISINSVTNHIVIKVSRPFHIGIQRTSSKHWAGFITLAGCHYADRAFVLGL